MKTFNKFNIGSLLQLLLVLSFVVMPVFAFAQDSTAGAKDSTAGTPPASQSSPGSTLKPIDINIGNPFKGGNNLTDIIKSILNNIVEPLAAVYVVIMIIYSGFKYVMAQGKPAEIEKANQGLLYVLIGAGILLGSAAISTAIQGTINQLTTVKPL
jgi:type IV secretory pathway VirB2 component (pilin)